MILLMGSFILSINAGQSTGQEDDTDEGRVSVKRIARCNDVECLVRMGDASRLLELAGEGNEEAKRYVAIGYAEEKFGFPQSPEGLRDQVTQGSETALTVMIMGIAEEKFGFEQDINLLAKYAQDGNKTANRYIYLGIKYGMCDIRRDEKAAAVFFERQDEDMQAYLQSFIPQFKYQVAQDIVAKAENRAQQNQKKTSFEKVKEALIKESRERTRAIRHMMQQLAEYKNEIDKGNISVAINSFFACVEEHQGKLALIRARLGEVNKKLEDLVEV